MHVRLNWCNEEYRFLYVSKEYEWSIVCYENANHMRIVMLDNFSVEYQTMFITCINMPLSKQCVCFLQTKVRPCIPSSLRAQFHHISYIRFLLSINVCAYWWLYSVLCVLLLVCFPIFHYPLMVTLVFRHYV